MRSVHAIHRWLAAVVAAAVAVQFLLAGAGAFGATSFQPHTAIGWAVAAVSLLVLLAALVGRSETRASGVLFAAVAAQVALGVLGSQSSAWFGAVHGLNALVVAGAAATLARRTAQRSSSARANAATPTSGLQP
jgi:hypothetical protein